MATSEAEICNIALSRVGVKKKITSLAENTTEAQECSTHYAQARDFILEAHPWPFAKRIEVLAALVVDDRTDWRYTYSLPTDCVAPRRLVDGANVPTVDDYVPYEIESAEDLDTSVLLTDLEDAELIYTARITNPTRFSPAFVDALAWQLAAELATPLTGKPQLENVFRAKAMMAISTASARALNQQRPGPQPESAAIRIRG